MGDPNNFKHVFMIKKCFMFKIFRYGINCSKSGEGQLWLFPS